MGTLVRNGGVLCRNACIIEGKGDILVTERVGSGTDGSVEWLDGRVKRGNGRS